MSDIIIYPESLSASVIGKEFSAKKPTELYVAVMTEILRNRPQIIGQKETHFTTDSVRAGQYHGKTRSVDIAGRTVYILTGLATKAKWQAIEKTCQLAGLTFEVDGQAKTVTKPAPQSQIKPAVTNTNTQSTQINKKICSKCGKLFNNLCRNDLCLECLFSDITEKYFKSSKTSNCSNLDDFYLKNKNIKRIHYGIKENNTLVHDNLGDWVLGEHKTPRGPEQLIRDSLPLYSIDELGEVNAYSFNSVTRSIYYARSGVIYEREYYTQNGLPYYEDKKICDCHNIVHMLWAGNMLFITEISSMQFKERREYEFCMGDYGYMSDDYIAHLHLRIVETQNGEEIFRQEDFSAVKSVILSKNNIIDCVDANLNTWSLKQSGSSYTLEKIVDIDDIIKKNDISYSKLHQIRDKIICISYNEVGLFNDEGGLERHFIKEILT